MNVMNEEGQTSLTVASSRRLFLTGGLAFLAACSSGAGSATSDLDNNSLVLGGEDPTATAVPPTAETATSSGGGTDAAGNDSAVPTPTPDPERVDIAPTQFTYLDGTAGSFEDFAGRPLVVNFFAGWCPPCRAELPEFEEIFKKYEDQVDFLGFSVLDDVETTQKLLDETGVTFTVAMDPTQDIHFDLGGIAMPTTLFIDRFGKVAGGRFGAIPKDDLEALILEEIL